MDVEALEARARTGVAWAGSDDGARWAFRAALAVTAVVLYVAGRHQWFIRDDWAFIATRARIHHDHGAAQWLFSPQDGHWLTVPVLLYRAIEIVAGLGSYWPYLLLAMLPHVATVLLVRLVCRRVGVSEWTTTLACSILLVFGSGWENIVFAIQVSYNLSLLGFLAQLLLTDHDGRLDRRDVLGLVCGALGMMSSGFGPFFIVGIGLFLVLRGRFRAAVFAAVPLAVGYGLWWLQFGSDQAADTKPGGKSQIPAFTMRGLTATFEGITGIASLAGIALVATLAVTAWRRGNRIQPTLIALAATAVLMFFGVGTQRVGFGLETAAASRYVYMAAMLLVPAFALAVDRLRTLAPAAQTAGRLVLVTSVVLNTGSLLSFASGWAKRSTCEQGVFALLAGSPKTAAADPAFQPISFSADVRLVDLPRLVREDAIAARVPSTPAEEAVVDQALTPGNTVCLPAGTVPPPD